MGIRSTAAVAVLGALAIAATPAVAGPGKCLRAARATRGQCFQDCRDSYQNDFVSCFGSGGSCAQTCSTADQSCKAGPLQALHTCQWDATNPQSCFSALKAALVQCKSDPDPEACGDETRLAALKCRQACLDAQQPGLNSCQDAFRMCLTTCAGQGATTTTSTTTSSTSTTTTTTVPLG